MRAFFYLFTIIVFISMPVAAQTYPGWPAEKKMASPQPEHIDEAFAINEECQSSEMIRNFYDCDCVSAHFLDLRARAPSARQDSLLATARQKCANETEIAGRSYKNCLGWATQIRTDYERFCSCYANSYAKDFARYPNNSIRGRERMMTASMNICSTGNEIAEDRARQSVIERLKNSGAYERFFPGARTNPPSGNQPRNAP